MIRADVQPTRAAPFPPSGGVLFTSRRDRERLP